MIYVSELIEMSRMKHQKIKLVLSLDRLIVEVSKKMKKEFFNYF
jgi:hypothetical protein